MLNLYTYNYISESIMHSTHNFNVPEECVMFY